MTERVHRYLKQRLTLIGCGLGIQWHDSERDTLDYEQHALEWDDYLPIIQHSYNSVPNAATKISANAIVFGRDLRLPLDRIDSDDEKEPPTPDEWRRKMELRRAVIHSDASEALLRADVSRRAMFCVRRPFSRFCDRCA